MRRGRRLGSGRGAAGAGGEAGVAGSDAGGAGTAGMNEELPEGANDCTEPAFACRGACFSEVGEAHNGCELIARSGGETGMESIVATARGIFAIDSDRSADFGTARTFAPVRPAR